MEFHLSDVMSGEEFKQVLENAFENVVDKTSDSVIEGQFTFEEDITLNATMTLGAEGEINGEEGAIKAKTADFTSTMTYGSLEGYYYNVNFSKTTDVVTSEFLGYFPFIFRGTAFPESDWGKNGDIYVRFEEE